MELINANSMNPRLIVVNKTHRTLNLKFYYEAIKDHPIEIKNLKPTAASNKNIPVMRLNGMTKLMMEHDNITECVYNSLSYGNDIITITLTEEGDVLSFGTAVKTPQLNAVKMGTLMAKFYNIVIAIVLVLAAIIYIVQKFSN